MNSSHNEFSYDDSSLTTFEKVVLGIMLFLISIPGTVMLMILVQFDRIGGGYPLKRRITDHWSGKCWKFSICSRIFGISSWNKIYFQALHLFERHGNHCQCHFCHCSITWTDLEQRPSGFCKLSWNFNSWVHPMFWIFCHFWNLLH